MAASQEAPDLQAIEFDSLVKGMEDIQNHALNQHEQHLDTRVYLRSLEENIEKTCKETKQIKNTNMEDEGILHSLQCQSSELKQLIARENALVLASEEQREAVQRKIDSEKASYVKVLQDHEELMAKLADRFRKAPQVYSKEKIQEETLNEVQELEALKSKETALLLELEHFTKELTALNENQDLNNIRTLVEETETNLLQGKKAHKKEKKRLAKKKEELGKLLEEIQQLKVKDI